MVTDYIVVLVTAKNRAEAEKISQTLLEEKLVACVNIIDSVVSFFRWQGKIDRAEECLIIMKTHKRLFAELVERVKVLHSYDVPEVLALPVFEGSSDYLGWIKDSLT